jgi:hypothetical protein
MKPLFLFIPILIAFWSCEQPVATSPPGAFQYKAFDSTGTLVVQGWIVLDTRDSTHVVGEWRFAKIGEPHNIGPQVGEGNFEGSFYGGDLYLNLNPRFADNNVLLNGTLREKSFSGTWMWVGFPGPLNHGSFQAAR